MLLSFTESAFLASGAWQIIVMQLSSNLAPLQDPPSAPSASPGLPPEIPPAAVAAEPAAATKQAAGVPTPAEALQEPAISEGPSPALATNFADASQPLLAFHPPDQNALPSANDSAPSQTTAPASNLFEAASSPPEAANAELSPPQPSPSKLDDSAAETSAAVPPAEATADVSQPLLDGSASPSPPIQPAQQSAAAAPKLSWANKVKTLAEETVTAPWQRQSNASQVPPLPLLVEAARGLEMLAAKPFCKCNYRICVLLTSTALVIW